MTTRLCRPLLSLALLGAACMHRPGPINIAENVVTIENQTARDWRNVLVTVNDHFSGGAPALASGSRMTAPLSQFRTALGQPYDASRQMVYKIEVTATDANGEPVTLKLDRREKQKLVNW